MRPFEAALKGSKEIGFTIVAITFSLIAVFIPVLLMGGIVGRMFREFAVTIAVAIIISGFVSLTHGTNDAQKTMGVIGLALVAHGDFTAQHFHVPTWVVVSAASAIALGTFAGGWRIIRTVGMRIIKMDTAQGFVSQGAGAAVILASSHFGYPLSSTHVISGGVMGAGAAKRVSAVRWGVAGTIGVAWALTLPGAGLFGALAWWLADVFGSGALGPLLITLVAGGVLAMLALLRRVRVSEPVRV